MNIGILITARLKSTRLPMKVIKPICGKPMICHLIDRLKIAKLPQKIILCTSPISQDDPLEKIATQESIICYRGHPDDVLQRLTNAAKRENIDLIISCTADNPFVDPIYIDKLINFHLESHNDYSNVEGLPFGTFSYAISYSAMVKACKIKDEIDTEVWGGYFTQTGLFKTGTLKVQEQELLKPNLRLTVDTPEDFQLIQEIFSRLYIEGKIFNLKEIVTLFEQNPELGSINAHIQQKTAKPIWIKL